MTFTVCELENGPNPGDLPIKKNGGSFQFANCQRLPKLRNNGSDDSVIRLGTASSVTDLKKAGLDGKIARDLGV